MNLLIKDNINQFNTYITISKNEWNYSIDLKINIAILSIFNIEYKKEILFILKCYVLDQTSMLKNIYLISNEKDNNINIYYKINIKKIKKMRLYDFDNWIDDLIEEEKHYFINSDYIGFRFVFYKESISWLEDRIYPNIDKNIINKII